MTNKEKITEETLKNIGFSYGYTSNEEDAMSLIGTGEGCSKGWVYDEGGGCVKIELPNETDGGIVYIDDESFDRCLTFYFVKDITVADLKYLLKACRLENIIKDLGITHI